MGLVASISISRMNASINELSQVFKQTSAKMTAANVMRDSILLRSNTLYKIYLSNNFIEKNRLRLQLVQYTLNYKLARDKLYSYPMSLKERKLANTIAEETQAAKTVNNLTADTIFSGNDQKKIKQYFLATNTFQKEILAMLTKLVVLQDGNARKILQDNQYYQDTIIRIIGLLSTAAFFIGLLISLVVIRETSKKNTQIRYRASHDELTKLINRKEFEHQLTRAFHSLHTGHTSHALCLLDLDEFKVINDTYGHKAGDELLLELSDRIKNIIRKNDTLARLGGDEFGLLLKNCSLEKTIEITEGIVSLVKNHAFNWNNKVSHVGVSIGVTMLTDKKRNIKNMMHDADMACYAAKDMGKNQVQLHQLDDVHMKKLHRGLSWVTDVHRAVENKRFKLFVQAIKSVNPYKTRSLYEISLQLNDDDGTFIPSKSYLSVAERFNLMNRVDRWVVETVFRQLNHIDKPDSPSLPCIFISLSENSLTDADFPEFVILQYKKYNIQHCLICFELNEAAVTKNINLATNFIHVLQKYNIRFALDNFGNALSSMHYLKNLPVDYLKIDGEIIRNMPQNTVNKALIAAINTIGKVMHIKIIAPQIDDDFTLQQLKETGTEFGLGNYFNQPEPIENLTSWLNTALQS